MQDRDARVRTVIGLAVIGVTLLLLPLMLNVARGGARGVGFDPRVEGSDLFFAVTYPAGVVQGPLDGRLLVVVSRDPEAEPRLQVSAGGSGQLVFGVDVEGWASGHPIEVTDAAAGFPLPSLAHIPPGHYRVQGVFEPYEVFPLPGGPTLRLPTGPPGAAPGSGPGSLVSRPAGMYVDPRASGVLRVDLAHAVAASPARTDTERLRHVRVRSERLSEFWGRDVHLEAAVTLPEGWVEGEQARYPLLLHLAGRGGGGADSGGHPGAPGALVATLLHVAPYRAGWQAVDSENLGPWGEALTHELVPEIERRLGGIGEARFRALVGAFTGGWEALAVQIGHPDHYGGAWAVCPGPVDFRAFHGVDLYGARSAFHYDRAWGSTPRPGAQAEPGGSPATLEQENQLERVLGSRGRSGGPWDAWDVAFSPRSADGYPRAIWDRDTGAIDPEVAAHWREHHDLRHVLERDRARLGPALTGRLHVIVGEADRRDPGEAVLRLEGFLSGAGDPPDGVEAGIGRCVGPGAREGWLEARAAVLDQVAGRLSGAAAAAAEAGGP